MKEVRFGYVFWVMLPVVLIGTYVVMSLVQSLQMQEFSIIDKNIEKDDSMLFVGDLMLSRHVERLMQEHGFGYPYRDIRNTLSEYTQVIGNLEGTAANPHVLTPEFSFQFSIQEDAIEMVAEEGFTFLTLANNHAYDYGDAGYENTQRLLKRYGIQSAGHPERTSFEDVAFVELNDVRIAIVPVHAVSRDVDTAHVEEILMELDELSDEQFIVIHWGEEYISVGNTQQQEMAHAFIDAGAEAIIGHHPHVVQNIEVYKGVPIFYSLGNFIFDQYWNQEVQEGLAVGVHIDKARTLFELIPIESSVSAPRILTEGDRTRFLEDLALRSDALLATDIQNGLLAFEDSELASSEKTVMIDTIHTTQ